MDARGTLDGGAVTDEGKGRGVNRCGQGQARPMTVSKLRCARCLRWPRSCLFHTREITRCDPSLCLHSFGPKPVLPRICDPTRVACHTSSTQRPVIPPRPTSVAGTTVWSVRCRVTCQGETFNSERLYEIFLGTRREQVALLLTSTIPTIYRRQPSRSLRPLVIGSRFGVFLGNGDDHWRGA